MTTRLRPVRLTDVPLDVRLRAARQLCRHETNTQERLALFTTAISPSSKIYYVRQAA